MISEELKKLVENAIFKSQKKGELPEFDLPAVFIEKPKIKNKNFGDFASAIAFEIAKKSKKNPKECAKILIKNFPESKILAETKILGAGFLNFYLSPFYLQEQIKDILKKKEKWGRIDVGKGEKVHSVKFASQLFNRVNIEFISANPTGPITIGNARGGFTGDTLANILSFTGSDVTREYYINDAGKQIRIFGESILRRILEENNIKVEYPDYCYQGEYIKDLAREIKKGLREKLIKDSLNDEKVLEKISDFGISKMKTEAKRLMDKLGIKFDVWFSEKELRKKGAIKKVLDFLKKKKLTYKKEGALWLKSESLGSPKDEVLITKEGKETYFLKDIAYHRDKFERGFSKIIVFVGADHFGHTERMAVIPKIFNYNGELKFLVTQFLRIKKGGKTAKISKRKGQIVTLEELVQEISLPVARFIFLTKDINSQMELDLDLLKERSKKNPVFYVQYAHARMSSILRKAKEKNLLGVQEDLSSAFFGLLNHKSEIDLIKKMIEFPEIVALISKNFEVHLLSYYAYSLAEKFSIFYRDCQVLSEKKGDVQKARLSLVKASQIVLQNVLRLAGIEAPEVM